VTQRLMTQPPISTLGMHPRKAAVSQPTDKSSDAPNCRWKHRPEKFLKPLCQRATDGQGKRDNTNESDRNIVTRAGMYSTGPIPQGSES